MAKNERRRDWCCRSFETVGEGFYCKICHFYVHKKCNKLSESIQHPSHSIHTLKLDENRNEFCSLCGGWSDNWRECYYCNICDFKVDLYCAKYPPPEVIDNPETHNHKLTLLKEFIKFDCSANCGNDAFGFAYKCHECDSTYHVGCAWFPSEVNHSFHSLHPLKLLKGQPPHYSDGLCRLCKRKTDKYFYHCSSCDFTLDMHCILNPPPQSLLDLKAHDHQLTFLPRLRPFTCNACGLIGDRCPYICIQCDFMIHPDCLNLLRVINVNRHDHRVSRTSVLGVVDSICGVCRKEVDWTCGGYSCNRCRDYVVHSKCATGKYVWNGKELEGEPEEIEDIEPYEVMDGNRIRHFSHKEHPLMFHANGILYEENKRCSACTHHIGIQSFYGCMDCDFLIHQNCANYPRKKWHVLHQERLTLIANKADDIFECSSCRRTCNGFLYKHRNMEKPNYFVPKFDKGEVVYEAVYPEKNLDIMCASVSEPFVHPSHPHHPLYYIPLEGVKKEICNGCGLEKLFVLRCIKEGCEFFLDFECAKLPQVTKHRVDDHPLSLCYGEKASGKCWCDICEKEVNLEKWFYTSKDHRASLHIECVLGNFYGLMPGSTIKHYSISYEVVLNNSVSRPFCGKCKEHCISPVILKILGTSDNHYCSWDCIMHTIGVFITKS